MLRSLTVESISSARAGGEVMVTEGGAVKDVCCRPWTEEGTGHRGWRGPSLPRAARRSNVVTEERQRRVSCSQRHTVSGPFRRVIRPRDNLLPPGRLCLWSESLASVMFSP